MKFQAALSNSILLLYEILRYFYCINRVEQVKCLDLACDCAEYIYKYGTWWFHLKKKKINNEEMFLSAPLTNESCLCF